MVAVRLPDFEALVRRLSTEVPAGYFEGIAEVVVSPRTIPHPSRADIYTLGECVPLPSPPGAGQETIQSRVILYHGSFAALARERPDFDWRQEAWDTLTHELRHHLEWRARTQGLESYDEAAEHNFARRDGEPFDPLFYTFGERVEEGLYQVEDDFFIERSIRSLPAAVEFSWRGRGYSAPVPAAATLPCFLTIEGIPEPPAGELVIVLRRPARLRDLFRASSPFLATVVVSAVG